MSKEQHTPGPWRVANTNAGLFVGGAPGKYGYLAQVRHVRTNQDPMADARLIAAAPDLLAALENARNVLAGLAIGDLKSISPDSAALKQARAAIAKATGED